MNRLPKIWYLRQCDLYAGISDEELKELSNNLSVMQEFGSSGLIYSSHDRVDRIYLIKRGEVKLYHSHAGKRVIFDTLMPGAVFGAFQSSTTKINHFAEAKKGTLVCFTPVEQFLKIISQKPELALNLLQQLATTITDYEQRLSTTNTTAKEKIYVELQRLSEKHRRGLFGRLMPQNLYITHEQIAELTGCNRVTVTKCLTELKKEKRIKSITGGMIQVL